MKFTDEIFGAVRARKERYRPLPFWSLNDRLSPEEMQRQVREMAEKGCGGYFLHARSGLLTDYMGMEWFESLDAAVRQGKESGTDSYVYDENGWPSGFADGKIAAEHPEYCLKWLECVPAPSLRKDDEVLACYGVRKGRFGRVDSRKDAAYAVCLRTSADYVDILDEETVRCFIDEVYEKYRARYGSSISGFFTDEPQYGSRSFPWSRRFAEKFYEKYGYDVFQKLPCLFFDSESSAAFRYDFYSLAEDMLNAAYYKQIGEWCEKHGYIFTGHGFDENSLFGQTLNCGDIMRHYEYMQMPGMDWLGRAPCNMAAARQVSSVARQLGKERVLSETFALCGWSVGLKRLRSIAERQFAGGINVLCQHLFAYSLKGERKRDYPPSHFLHQTWWKKYGAFSGYIASLGALLSAAEPCADLLVISPVRSAFMMYVSPATDMMRAYEAAFSETVNALERAAVAYELGSERILERHGKAENGKLIVGRRTYSRVLLPDCVGLDESTFRILSDFVSSGGRLYYSGQFPSRLNGRPAGGLASLRKRALRADDIPALQTSEGYTLSARGGSVFFQGKTECGAYIVFASNAHDRADSFSLHAAKGYALYRLDLEKENAELFLGGEVCLGPYGSALFACVPSEEQVPAAAHKLPGAPLPFVNGMWRAEPGGENALVLDGGEYSFCGGQYKPMRDVRLLFDTLMKGRKNGTLKLRYVAELRGFAGKVFFASETPADKKIYINGSEAKWKDEGSFIDPCIRKTDVTPLLHEGKNEIVVETEFFQTEYTYHVYNDNVMETEKNKIRYDSELENCYLLGNFGVYGKNLRRENGLVFADGFSIGEPCKALRPDSLTENGWFFFAGTMKLKNSFLSSKEGENRIKLRFLSDYAEVFINGKLVGEGYAPEFDGDVSAYVREGENDIEIRLYSSLRNIFGPFHHREGDPEYVGLTAFADGGGWSDPEGSLWRERYAAVPFGLSAEA